jgi:hypothetical protein
MEDNVKDVEYLCLDSTYYGNIARFLNHRCGDANLEHYNVHIQYCSPRLYYALIKHFEFFSCSFFSFFWNWMHLFLVVATCLILFSGH